MGLFQDEKAKAESVLLADEIKAKAWFASNKSTAVALIVAFVLGVIIGHIL